MVISSEQACQRGWKGEIVQQCPKIQALCLESTVCCWVPEVQFQSFVTVTTATTSSSSTLHWLSSPFRGGVNESRFTSSPALSCVKVSSRLHCTYALGFGSLERSRSWTLEIPKSGTLGLRSVAERRRFWFLRAVLKLSSLCKAAADTAREDPSAILAT